MLQYFLDNHYTSAFQRGYTPTLEYVCNVGPDSSHMPRTMHEHDHLVEILLLYGGTGIYMIDANRYTAQRGDIILYNSRTIHDEFGGNGSDLSTYCIAISGLRLPGLPEDTILPKGYSPVLPAGKDFEDILTLYRLIENACHQPGGAETANYLARALVLKIIARIRTNGKPLEEQKASLATLIKAYLDKHYRENIHLEDIASATNSNAYYLSHVFKSDIGLSPMRYVALRRLGEAQNLLINTNMTVTQIAASIGYNNSNYFQNVFRNAIHMTPGEYRRKWTR